MMRFEELIQPRSEEKLLDIGGFPVTWTQRPQLTKSIECINIDEANWDPTSAPDHRITFSIGDGCNLGFPDGSFDIVFSNSVIEHVGDWEQQRAFASESRRVAKRLWIQTPALECPVEPHYLAPFVHWLPIFLRRRLLRWFTPWGWIAKPSQEVVDQTIKFTRLLSKRQMTELYPDCTIITERLLWIFPKSYVAYRTDDGKQSDSRTR